MSTRDHLRLMPSPTARRPIERVDSGPILARLAECGDPRKMHAAFLAAIAERNDAIVALRERLDEANERLALVEDERDRWRRAYTLATARRPWRTLPLAWATAVQLAWAWFWGLFETAESRGGVPR